MSPISTGPSHVVTFTSHIVTGHNENLSLTSDYVIVYRDIEAVFNNDESKSSD